jgi:tetratricopeptide (TPR) repeat protein
VHQSGRVVSGRNLTSAAIVSMLLAAMACAHVPARSAGAQPDPLARMQAADRLLAAGCYDCLVSAFAEYDALREVPELRQVATDAAEATAALIAVRENELGLLPSHSLERARQFRNGAAAREDVAVMLDIAETIAATPAGQGRGPATDTQISAVMRLSRNQLAWAEALRRRVPDDLPSTYLWLALACGTYGSNIPDRDDRRDVVGAAVETPLVSFKEAISCSRDADRLRAIGAADPRFRETDYFIGLAALAPQPRAGEPVPPDAESADLAFQRAYEWRQDWPALTLAIANLALAGEDFVRASDFYDRTLALVPLHPEALLGRIRTLSYLGRASDAIAAADQLLDAGYSPGEARYWRALNEARLNENDQAWEDVEIANRLLVNADVPKLAGSIAVNQRRLDVARQKFELAHSRNPHDCEVQYYLQSVLAEQAQWSEAARLAADAAACFDVEEATRREEIRVLGASNIPPERRERRIARREQQLAVNARMRATAWFNAAVAYFNLGQRDQARRFADKVVDDQQFTARVREMLRRLEP